jgi:chromosome segregation ATPase
MDKTTEVIIKTLRRIEDNQASMDRDMSKDRQDLQNLTIKVDGMASELEQLRKAVNLSAERTKDKVAEAVQPVTKATDNLASKIEKSKTVIFGEPKKNLWERFVEKWT